MKTYLMLGAAALALTACKLDGNPSTATPQFAAAAPFDLGLAPGYDALPAANQAIPITYAPQPVAQTYWNDAYSMGQTYYDQPPSYFPYNGATPLVWNQGDMITRIVEALVGGGQREYYYQPNAAYPYFVRDPQYAYAYDDGQLIAAYDPYGQPLPLTVVEERSPIAAQYLVRAQTLYDVARRTSPRALTPKVWTVERRRLVSDVRNPAWKSWWTPVDNRSPVAVRRLTEVRQRKLERDLAHDDWKAKAVRVRTERQQLKFAAQHPQYRAEAAPAGQRIHSVIAPAKRRAEAPKWVEARQVQTHGQPKKAAIRQVAAHPAPKHQAEVRQVKAQHAPAAADHGRPAAFHGGAAAKTHGGGAAKAHGGAAVKAHGGGAAKAHGGGAANAQAHGGGKAQAHGGGGGQKGGGKKHG